MAQAPSQPDQLDTLAALDLGSNSFHLIVAQLEHGQLRTLDRIKTSVRLAAGLDAEKSITPDTWGRAIETVKTFGERVAELKAGKVRAVGTNTLRKARNSEAFLQEAAAAFGHPIEVISGREEARLIYLGVTQNLEHSNQRRLVVDIGGGSTELIVGQGSRPLERDSMQMGCVTYTMRHFPNGKITRTMFDNAETAARLELRSRQRRYRELNWAECLGASGTIKAIDAILRANGWSRKGISAEGLHTLKEKLIAAGKVSECAINGLSDERKLVLPGGLAILIALFERLELDEMTASEGALREGLLWDLLGRLDEQDTRDRTVYALQNRYSVDISLATRLEATALQLFDQAHQPWNIPRKAGIRFLRWAAQLHEIGRSLSFSGYHRHGAYIIENSDLPGFSRDDKALLAALIGAHRRKLTAERLSHYVSSGRIETTLRLAILLRLAHRLHRTRSRRQLPDLDLDVGPTSAVLTIDRQWLAAHPLTHADLLDECHLLRHCGYDVQLHEGTDARHADADAFSQ